MSAPQPPLANPLLAMVPGFSAPHLCLGQYPTPVQPLPFLGAAWVKREDQSSPIYGGNKVRTLEFLLANMKAQGSTRLWGLGAYGSNHALAAVLHGRRAGLEVRALLFPQPATATATDNLRATWSHADGVTALRTIATFPLHILRLKLAGGSYVMPPGGAVPLGAFGHASAALELAQQVKSGLMPAPAHIVLAVGSTCTTAGLMAGLCVARHLGLWPGELPVIHSVRVTPWPVTARFRVAGLARRTLLAIAQRGGPGLDPAGLPRLAMHGRYLGKGYGKTTRSGLEIAQMFADKGGPPLDTTYAGKSGAALADLARTLAGPLLFWSTKSSVPLPADDPHKLQLAPAHVRQWLGI